MGVQEDLCKQHLRTGTGRPGGGLGIELPTEGTASTKCGVSRPL